MFPPIVAAYKCQHGLAQAPTYLRDELRRPADTESRRLSSASPTTLDVLRIGLLVCPQSATGHFPVAAARLWNSLPSHVIAAPSPYLLLSS